MEDTNSEYWQRVVDLFDRIDIKQHQSSYEALSRKEQIIYDLIWFSREVDNGGLNQYLYNSSGDHWFQTLDGLQQIGAVIAHADLKAACDLFPSCAPSSDWCERQVQMKQLLKVKEHGGFDETLDDRVGWDCPPYEDLDKLLWEFWQTSE